MLIALNACLVVFSDSWNVVLICFNDGAWVVPLALAVITMRGSTVHPCSLMSSISGWYFWILLVVASWENLSLVYVNSINWTVRLAVGDGGGLF